ncbi:SDR family NAD(P)-dependent oxidoreductase [Spirosoma spitsbergense]|uniref:SDR family NAD(P)-dependent oxidoreductase n=1 Tax=Spirosoma spitsbergense TaxID=431554 RepID=UPI0003651B48|nr:SDR family NAD(P)-dependent oxidoreductase [Spirosoma spitsbergense]
MEERKNGKTALITDLTKLYLNDMVSRNEGKILMLGSEVSVIPNPMMAVYGATKAFIKSFSEAIRNEIKDKNVTITVLMPGATNTNFFKVVGAGNVKGADPQKTASPADVAKEGYEALMQGKDHVVAGWMNKARVAIAHVLPDPLLAANVRKDMTPKQSEEDQKNVITIAVLTGALVLGGLWLFLKNRNGFDLKPGSAYDRARYWHKAKDAERSAKKTLETVSNAVKDTYKKARTAVEEELA